MNRDEKNMKSLQNDAENSMIDPDGDVILKCQNRDDHLTRAFRVSSKVLRLASPVFAGMFRPQFEEGNSLLQREYAVVELKEDDAAIMSVILQIVHFRCNIEDDRTDSETLARLAIHCDKYDMSKSLCPWVAFWFAKAKSMDTSVNGLGCQLLAAYTFNVSKEFKAISETALKKVSPVFEHDWKSQELLALLPINIKDAMSLRIKRTLDDLEAEVQNIENTLRLSLRSYETFQRMCTACGRTLPEQAKKCHRCQVFDLPLKYCERDTRIADYFAILRQVELWPTLRPFGNCSISDIMFRIICAQTDVNHACSAGLSCPLLVNLGILTEKARRIEKNIRGFCLRCIREDYEWDESKRCTHLHG
ncbi:hypothetical protein PMIN03_011532 [Paraphaeosphaeria minitans]